ncbi:MAG: alpha/beta hydrolase fold domain-containing protein [Akkermansiaceae bacterium]
MFALADTPKKSAVRRSAATQPQQQLNITYKTTDRGPLKLDLYYPAASSAGTHPLVIYTHGGGWAAGSKDKARSGNPGKAVDAILRKGFCVAAVQYRLCQKGSSTIRDCVIDSKDAMRFLARNAATYRLDPQRFFTFGDSAGGHIAQMLLLSPPSSLPGDPALANAAYTLRAGVSWYGPGDFEKTELFNPDGRPNFRDRFGARVLPEKYDPADKLSLYREVSPVNYLTGKSPPLLMIQGDGDTTIPVHHAHYMAKKAKSIGAPVEIMIIKNAGHNWRQADGKTPIAPTKDDIFRRSADFLAAHCPPPFAPK